VYNFQPTVSETFSAITQIRLKASSENPKSQNKDKCKIEM
jgi:hypothetical protein